MKLLGIFAVCCVFLMLAGIKSSEAQENLRQLDGVYPGLQDGYYGIEQPEILNRQKRLTCDIHWTACVVHCRYLDFRTGFCKNGICNCRD